MDKKRDVYITLIKETIEKNDYELMEFKYEDDSPEVYIPYVSKYYADNSTNLTQVAILEFFTDIDNNLIYKFLIIPEIRSTLDTLLSLEDFNEQRFWTDKEWQHDMIYKAIYQLGIQAFENIIDNIETKKMINKKNKRRRDKCQTIVLIK